MPGVGGKLLHAPRGLPEKAGIPVGRWRCEVYIRVDRHLLRTRGPFALPTLITQRLQVPKCGISTQGSRANVVDVSILLSASETATVVQLADAFLQSLVRVDSSRGFEWDPVMFLKVVADNVDIASIPCDLAATMLAVESSGILDDLDSAHVQMTWHVFRPVPRPHIGRPSGCRRIRARA